MLSIDRELKAIVTRLQELRIPYALCGGLAMAVHGYPRATLDIDLLSLRDSTQDISTAARTLGYTLTAAPMTFADGDVRIFRISKLSPEDEDVLPLDILSLSPAIEAMLTTEETEWEGVQLCVVDARSLICLKRLRNNAQDLADIERLTQ
ncbi:MAG: hypothetical protein QOD99_208 [Chthoniobacter sp.]|jgi:hypothetical protein|nr:hypothetical protein [Chthoniobacter sp.]